MVTEPWFPGGLSKGLESDSLLNCIQNYTGVPTSQNTAAKTPSSSSCLQTPLAGDVPSNFTEFLSWSVSL